MNVNGSGSGLAIGGFSTDAGKLQVYYPSRFGDRVTLTDGLPYDGDGRPILSNGAYTSTSVDADNLKTTGSYWIHSDVVSNIPVGNGNYGVLSVDNPAPNLYKQTFTLYNNGRTWVRQYTNGNWYDWFEICVNVQGKLANTLAINNANPSHTQSVNFSYIRQGFTATVYASFTFDNFTSSNTSTTGTYFFNGRSFEAGLFGKNDGTITAYGNCVIGWGNSYTISRKANESIFIEGLTNATAKGQTAIAQIHLAYIAP